MISSLCVFGAGTMGSGIAQVFAEKGFDVFLVDKDKKSLDTAIIKIKSNLDKLVNNGMISPVNADDRLKRISFLYDYKKIPAETPFLIEAIYEDKLAKFNLFNELQKIFVSDTIFATNTSSISITELARNNRPERFIGMHFMNPVPKMKLVEIIRGHLTSDDTFKVVYSLTEKLDKVPVEVMDFPGFISNRLLMPMINEAIFALMEGVGSKEDIDKVMKLGMNHPMGPLALADFIGLDVCLSIMEVLYDGFKDDKYRPCTLLRNMVNANKLGKKTGEGFYKY
jgi:3-hydroxybutyryl-CoA dehydrogenase